MATKQEQILAEVRVTSALLKDLKETDIREVKEDLKELNDRTRTNEKTANSANTKAKIALYASLIALGGIGGGSAMATKILEMW